MTGLEALNKFVNIFAEYCVKTQHQEMNATNMQTAVEYLARSNECRTIEKSLKALEIIKEKNVDVIRIKHLIFKSQKNPKYWDLRYYNEARVIDVEKLTQEEFNLLKGILNEE